MQLTKWVHEPIWILTVMVIQWPWSLMSFANFFSLQTAMPIKVKFQLEPPWDGGTKICSSVSGHMTNMTAMPIYGKNFKNPSSLESKGRWKLVCSIGCSITTKFVQMMTLDWQWPILRQVPICHPYAFVWEKVKAMDFSEAVVALWYKSW